VPALAAEARASPERLYCQHRSGSKSASERLEQIGKRFVTAVLENQRHIAIFARKEKDLAPEDYRRISEMRRTFDHKLVRLPDEGFAAGEFHIADTRLAALAIGGMVSWAYVWYRQGGRLTLEQTSGELTRLILNVVNAKRPQLAAPPRKPSSPRKR